MTKFLKGGESLQLTNTNLPITLYTKIWYVCLLVFPGPSSWNDGT